MENKKVLILDFDGTFYSGEDIFAYVDEYVNRNRRKFIPDVDDEIYADICKTHPNWNTVSMGKAIVNELYSIKKDYPAYEIGTSAFWNHQNEEVYNIKLDNAKIVNHEEIEKIAKMYPTYIVSNSSPKHIYHYMDKFNIDKSVFKGIFSNRFIEEDPTKEHYYKDIMDLENVLPEQIYVFGDSDSSDLEPARRLSQNAFLSTDASKLCSLIEEKLQ